MRLCRPKVCRSDDFKQQCVSQRQMCIFYLNIIIAIIVKNLTEYSRLFENNIGHRHLVTTIGYQINVKLNCAFFFLFWVDAL